MALVVALALVLGVYCVVRYDHFGAGLDLSLFDQAIWHYSRFQAPFSTIKGYDLLGDHFTPSVALWAPLYWVWADPRLLLGVACLVVEASIVPVFLFARDRLGRRAAYLLAVAYGVFWGLQTGAGYEFHEVDLAPLAIALAILCADRRRWGWFAVAIAVTLGIKEDLGLFVAFFGIFFLTRRQWRAGVSLVLVGVAWYVLATQVFIPDLSFIGRFEYWSYGQFGANLPAAVGSVLEHPWRLFTVGFSPSTKASTLLDLFAPFLFASLFSRWFVLAIPLLAERFLSTNSAYWGTSFHYSLTIAPVLAMSAAAGLANLRRWLAPRFVIRTWVPAAGMAAVSLGLAFALTTPFRTLTWSTFWTTPPFAPAADRAVAHVPRGAPVSANDALLPRLSTRSYAGELPQGAPPGGYLIVNLGEPVGSPTGEPTFAALGRVEDNELVHATPTYYSDDWVVARVARAGVAPSNGVLKPGYGAVEEQIGLDRYEILTGRSVTAQKVRANLPGFSYRYYDGLAEKPDGTYEGIEVKGNSASYYGSQVAFDSAVSPGNPATAILNGERVKITSVRLIRVP